MSYDKAYYERLASFCWKRAHKATNPIWRTRWFDIFEMVTVFRDITRT